MTAILPINRAAQRLRRWVPSALRRPVITTFRASAFPGRLLPLWVAKQQLRLPDAVAVLSRTDVVRFKAKPVGKIHVDERLRSRPILDLP